MAFSAIIPRELKATGTGAFSGAGTGAVTDLVSFNNGAAWSLRVSGPSRLCVAPPRSTKGCALWGAPGARLGGSGGVRGVGVPQLYLTPSQNPIHNISKMKEK